MEKKSKPKYNISFKNYAVNKIEKPGAAESQASILQFDDNIIPLGAKFAMSQMAVKTGNTL